jgi:sentrin-specific protease 1
MLAHMAQAEAQAEARNAAATEAANNELLQRFLQRKIFQGRGTAFARRAIKLQPTRPRGVIKYLPSPRRVRNPTSTVLSDDHNDLISAMLSYGHNDKGTQTDPVDQKEENYAEHEAYWRNLERTATSEVDIHRVHINSSDRATQINRPLLPKSNVDLDTLAIEALEQSTEIQTPTATTQPTYSRAAPFGTQSRPPKTPTTPKTAAQELVPHTGYSDISSTVENSPVQPVALTPARPKRVEALAATPAKPQTPFSDISSTVEMTRPQVQAAQAKTQTPLSDISSTFRETPPKTQTPLSGFLSTVAKTFVRAKATEPTHQTPSSDISSNVAPTPVRTEAIEPKHQTPYSDISSNVAPTPLAYHTVQSVADAVGSPSSSTKAPRKSPLPRTSRVGIIKSPPGAWIDEETTTEQDQKPKEATLTLTFKTPARRAVSDVALRGSSDDKKKEEVEERARTPPEHATPPKSSAHARKRDRTKQEIKERQEEAQKKKNQYTIAPLSQEWDDKVEEYIQNGLPEAELTAKDLGRCAPPRDASDNHDNWLNDEVVNKYLKMVTEYGNNLAGRPRDKTPAFHAFTSFFYSKLADPKQGVKTILRWVNKARIGGKRMLETEMVFVPINSGAHWTLAVVSGVNRTISYYDSLGSKRSSYMEVLLGWLEVELGDAFVRSEWKLQVEQSGRQANMDDCGVFTVTNARSLVLGVTPYEFTGEELARIQRRRIVAELANGSFLVGGA